MTKAPAFRPRVQFVDKIRAMKPKAQLYFAGAKAESLKSIASRVGAEYNPKRVYYTQAEKSGVIVWRET